MKKEYYIKESRTPVSISDITELKIFDAIKRFFASSKHGQTMPNRHRAYIETIRENPKINILFKTDSKYEGANTYVVILSNGVVCHCFTDTENGKGSVQLKTLVFLAFSDLPNLFKVKIPRQYV